MNSIPEDKDAAAQSGLPVPKLTLDPATHKISEPTAAAAPKIQAPSPPPTSVPARAKPMDLDLMPDRLKSGATPPTTTANIEYLLEHYGIQVRYDVIKKRLNIAIPGQVGTVENAENVSLTYIYNLVTLNGMSTFMVADHIYAIADKNAHNPVRDWIESKTWDGKNRLKELCDTVTVAEDYPDEFKCILIEKWLLSAVAAALMNYGFHNRGVLTFQGRQGIGKTSWLLALITCDILRHAVVKIDHHMDRGDKDSIIDAITNWIVELGELEGSLRKNRARLKGFITSTTDKVRRPYTRAAAEYPRRTVFAATVNDRYFLLDRTGNSRFWTLPVAALNYKHGIDMQQVFAQLAVQFHAGAEWWLTPDEEQQLEELNRRHQAVSVIRESLLDVMDLERVGQPDLKAMTASEILELAGITPGTNAQARECGAIMRELVGEPKRIQGRDKWRFPKQHDGFDRTPDGIPFDPYD